MKIDQLVSKLNPQFIKLDEPLSRHTTLKIGGNADVLFEANSKEDLVFAVKIAKELEIPVTILGWGSNVLISDNGIRGLVIKNKSSNIEIGGEKESITGDVRKKIEVRLDQVEAGLSEQYIGSFTDLDYDESDKPIIEVKMDSGVYLPFAINYTIDKGLTGLQWYAKIPGTIGGAVYNNIHGGSHFIGEITRKVTVLDDNLNEKLLEHSELEMDYDESRFHKTNEIILDVTFELRKGDAEKARAVSIEWARRKKIQPTISPGCAFANLSNEDRDKHQFASGGTGWFVEKELKLTGFRIGDAAIDKNHHNFITNLGHATAIDYLKVLKHITKLAKEKYDIDMKTEIFFIGFTPEELVGLNVPGGSSK